MALAQLRSPIADAPAVPTEFRIFAMGVNDSEKGAFLFDAFAAELVMAEYHRHGKALLFDFNHSATFSQPTPEQAIAAGEFVPEVRADGLWATQIKWTARARSLLEAKEYRYFSPLFEHDPKTRRVIRLINVALVNLPALNGIAPLVAASMMTTKGTTTMTKEEIERLRRDGLNDAQIAAFPAFEAEQREREALSASGSGGMDPALLKILKLQGVDPLQFVKFEREQAARNAFSRGPL